MNSSCCIYTMRPEHDVTTYIIMPAYWIILDSTSNWAEIDNRNEGEQIRPRDSHLSRDTGMIHWAIVTQCISDYLISLKRYCNIKRTFDPLNDPEMIIKNHWLRFVIINWFFLNSEHNLGPTEAYKTIDFLKNFFLSVLFSILSLEHEDEGGFATSA